LNVKIIAVVVVIALAVAGAGAYFLMKDKDKEINILAGVNTEGSGIYIDASININTMFDYSTPIPTPKPAGWEGKIFGTPGISTIQHVQLLQIVESMGMNFVAYTIGGNNNAPNTVYFVAGIFNATLAINDNIINGGTLWQPQYQKIVDNPKYKELALTNDLFPGHACCVIAGYHGYTKSHEDETARFLAAFVKATNWVNNALSDKTSSDYAQLVSIAKNVAGPNFSEQEIKDALDTVSYFYGENNSNPLANLSGQIAALSENLVELKVTTKTLKDLGFNNGTEFANKFVNDRFLVKALGLLEDDTPYDGNTASIRVAVITGDIHQVAVHVAKELGFFDEFGLNVSFSQAVNGPGVATAIQNGDASFGLMGAPPITTTVINGELVKAYHNEQFYWGQIRRE
jgi:ABC-type nitrate/sulfonate/bicarbonate transport system substrate-binding protein